ncbi:hypothetical protein H0H93_015488 [Arthromyces matolae]|nr:hypothetical protein H0H93_015488 [Arthromyces matolae]
MPTDLAYLASLVPITPGGQISRSTNESAEGRQTAQFQPSSGSTTPAPSSSYPYPIGSNAPSQQHPMKQEAHSLRRKMQDKMLSGLTEELDATRTKYEELKGRVEMFEIREAELSAREKQVQRTQEDFIQREMEVTQKKELLNQREKIVTEREEAVKKEGQKVHAWRVRMKQETVTAVLNLIFSDTNHYKGLLSCDKSDAQAILDSFQLLLDTDNFNDRTQMIAAMRRLSEGTELYPTCFCLDGPFPTLEDDPVSSGAYGDIYKLLYKGRETCCKVIRVYQQSLAERMSKMYAREVIVWGQLRHPNILPFYGISKYRSRVAFISQWASHGDINEYIKQTPHANRILLAFDTACGVKYLHQNDIVHGDLKGVNVLVNSSGRACLGDFGLSSVEDPEIIRWTSQSTVASKGGTTRWQAPELLESEDIAEKIYNSKESDVYAWGGVCYEST